MAVISVSTPAGLANAIATAVAGDIISCATGNYGTLNVSRVMGVGGLTITSANQAEASRARFSQVFLNGSDRITLSYLYFDYVRGATPLGTTTVSSYDAKRHSLLYNIFDGDYGAAGYGWGVAIGIYGNSVDASTDHIIQGNIIRKYNYGIQMNTVKRVLIQGNSTSDISNDHNQFAQVEDVDVIHNYYENSRLEAGSGAHPDAGQLFTTATTVPSKRVKRLRNILNFTTGTYTEGFFANNEIFNGGNTAFRYEGFEYRDNWMKCNHLECLTLHGGNGLIIENNNVIASPIDATDPHNIGVVTSTFGGDFDHVVWIPRINVLNTIGSVSVQGNRFWAGPSHAGSRLVFTGSTSGFVILDNLLNKDAPGPSMPTFTLGGDGLGGAVLGTLTNGCTFRGGY